MNHYHEPIPSEGNDVYICNERSETISASHYECSSLPAALTKELRNIIFLVAVLQMGF